MISTSDLNAYTKIYFIRKKMKLNRLSDRKFTEKQMNMVMGGAADNCPNGYCGCPAAETGGSSKADNLTANYAKGLYTVVDLPIADIVHPK
jgi:natural product precursor